ncbi:hypothetical protein HDU82_005373 [Entophlyctis luteolus]|nr:hypothetical protein HDU82_005373 [Entophlyctis luteolus]
MSCSDCANLLSIPVFKGYHDCNTIPGVSAEFSDSSKSCFSSLSINTSLGLTVDEFFEHLIPTSSALQKLASLSVTNAGLTGDFPDILSENQLHHLVSLDISKNSITGQLPSLTGSSVSSFDASENLFAGKISESYLSHLTGNFNFTYNCLTGKLPASASLNLFQYQNGLKGTVKNPNPDCWYEPEDYAVAGTSSSSSTTTTTTAAAATPTLSSLNGCVVQQQIYANNPNNTVFYKNLVNPCPANNSYMFWAYKAATTTLTTTSTKTVTTKSTSSSKSSAKSSATSSATSSSSTKTTTSVHNIRLRRRDRLGRRRVFAKRDTSTESYAGLGLTGPLPSLLGSLVSLTSLDLSGNTFTGTWPSSFSNLVNLRTLNVANSGITDALPAALQAIITANGGTVNWGTACNAQNPNAVCPKPKIPPVDCFALSRDSTFVDPMYDTAWKSWSHAAGEASLEGTLQFRPNPDIGEFYYAQFVQYIHSLRYCQKHHPEYTYWTYARVHPPGKPVAIPINEESQEYGVGQPYLQGVVPEILGS